MLGVLEEWLCAVRGELGLGGGGLMSISVLK